jgi:hypothetical protein
LLAGSSDWSSVVAVVVAPMKGARARASTVVIW